MASCKLKYKNGILLPYLSANYPINKEPTSIPKNITLIIIDSNPGKSPNSFYSICIITATMSSIPPSAISASRIPMYILN